MWFVEKRLTLRVGYDEGCDRNTDSNGLGYVLYMCSVGGSRQYCAAAHRSSPATADALLHELNDSAPALLSRITSSVPGMLPKAYRWVDEMYEISDFVGEGEGDIHRGIGKLYERVQRSLESDSQGGDVEVLNEFVSKAKELMKDE